MAAHELNFLICILGETVEANEDGLAELPYVPNVFVEIGKSRSDALGIWQLDFGLRDSSVHLEALERRYEHGKGR